MQSSTLYGHFFKNEEIWPNLKSDSSVPNSNSVPNFVKSSSSILKLKNNLKQLAYVDFVCLICTSWYFKYFFRLFHCVVFTYQFYHRVLHTQKTEQ